MTASEHSIEEIAQQVHNCLLGMGIEAELQVANHDAVVSALVVSDENTMRIVAHLSDREAQPSGAGSSKTAASHVTQAAAVFPTLTSRSASGTSARSSSTAAGAGESEQADT